MSRIQIYDTTLRDGTQAEDISLSTEDKIRIARKLDELGVAYIEGGWPGSNPTDKSFFKEIRNYSLSSARIAAFGSTHNPKNTAENDPNLQALVDSEVDVATIFGKTWDIHVTEALRIPLERNLELIASSVAFLKKHCAEVFFDCEHFVDGFKANRDYAMACLRKAHEAGADALVLCDTNGGNLPNTISDVVAACRAELPEAALGIHCHNDSELAVANTIAAVQGGCTQVQGTINGYGERCGNANLSSIIPVLELKLNMPCLPEGRLRQMTQVSAFVSEVANLQPFKRQPFVGSSAFAHKGGIHVSAVMLNPKTYEHIPPESVGNKQRILLSDLSGQSNILFKAREFGFDLDKNDPWVLDLLSQIKDKESLGYDFSAAEASFELLLNRTLGRSRKYFTLLRFRVLENRQVDCGESVSEATVLLKVGGETVHTAASGRGPVNALDNALRKGLETYYPKLKEMRLLDFKVRVLSSPRTDERGSASNVRVLIESGDTVRRWTTVGVSFNIIDASWQALEDSVNYKLFAEDKEKLTKALKG